LRKACIEADLLMVQIKDRPGMADEARPRIILRNAEGKTHELAKWAADKVSRFDQVYKTLLALRKKTEGVKPVYEGKYPRDWKPVKAPGTKTSMKGWELYVWQEKGDTFFSLLPGTNRLKTDEKITKVAVKGIDAIKAKLAELKAGEEVFVVGKKLMEPPPKNQASPVVEYGKKIGLKVQGQSQ
jgi:hypothetical protein